MGQKNIERLTNGAALTPATLTVSGATTLTGALTQTGAITAASTLAVTGLATLSGGVGIDADSTLTAALVPSASGYTPVKIITEATAARTISALDYSALIVLTGASGITTLTLPAAAAGNAGAVVSVISQSDHAHVITLVNGIVAVATITSDSITAAEANKIGQAATLVSDGAKWCVVSLTGSWTVAA